MGFLSELIRRSGIGYVCYVLFLEGLEKGFGNFMLWCDANMLYIGLFLLDVALVNYSALFRVFFAFIAVVISNSVNRLPGLRAVVLLPPPCRSLRIPNLRP